MLPCHRHAELFFAESPTVLAQAQRLCAECPVREMCLAGALERREPHGVWGGEILVDGVVVASKRGRGRPRKVVAQGVA
jgi:WhiB family redox-sensing transcriptional regulator